MYKMKNSLEMTPNPPPLQSNLQAMKEKKHVTIFGKSLKQVSVFELNIFYVLFSGRLCLMT